MTAETLTARLARLQHPGTDPTYILYELLRAGKAGELIALDVPTNGTPAQIWANGGVSGMGSWNAIQPSDTGVPQHPYIAQSALRSALRAERVAGMREAAAWCDDYENNVLGWGEHRNAVIADRVAAECANGIRAAADKMEAGE